MTSIYTLQILTSGAVVSLGDDVVTAAGVGSFEVELAGAVSAAVTFSSPGIDASYKENIAKFHSEITVCARGGDDDGDG